MCNDNVRLLSRQDAAAYCGVSPSTFAGWVRSGHMPAPVFGKRWDKRAIDATLDKASGLAASTGLAAAAGLAAATTETEYQKRKRERARSA